MKIHDSHPFLSNSQDIAEIIKPLKNLGIIHFDYGKVESNGARTYLTSEASDLENYFHKKFYLKGNTESEPRNYTSQVVMWSTLPKQYLYDGLRAKGIDHGIFMFKSHENYCEHFSFAADKNNFSIINTYLSNLDILKSFTKYFKEQAALIIKKAEKNKIILPFNQDPVNFISEDNYNVSLLSKLMPYENLTNVNLSVKQRECSILLLRGKTAKEIAEILGLSARTVEYYLNTLKVKFGCKNKAALIAQLSQHLSLDI